MSKEPDLSTIAALIGDQARATILSALLGGQALPASELAYRAHIEPQTASSHLAKLVEGGLLVVNSIGRHRYFQLKNREVAQALEALAVIAPPPQVNSPRQSAELEALRFARTCYDHLAGKLGVAVTQALVDRRFLVLNDLSYQITEQGADWFATWDINPNQLRKGRRRLACACLDWSERRYHVAGALGAALATSLLNKGWVLRIPGSRAVRMTESGRAGFRHELSLDV